MQRRESGGRSRVLFHGDPEANARLCVPKLIRRLSNGSGLHDHVADDLALLDQLVCLDGAVQGQCCPDGVLYQSVLKPARQISDPPFPGRCWKFVHNEEPDGRPAHDHRAELKTNLRSVGTVGYAKAVLPDNLRQQVCIPGDTTTRSTPRPPVISRTRSGTASVL